MKAYKPSEFAQHRTSDSPLTVTCTGCPMGCLVTVTQGPNHEWIFAGAHCVRGETYARQEISDPVRPLTTLVVVSGSKIPLSVKTSQPVPKALFGECLKAIHQLKLQVPIHLGDVLIENLLGTGIAVLATRNLERSPEAHA